MLWKGYTTLWLLGTARRSFVLSAMQPLALMYIWNECQAKLTIEGINLDWFMYALCFRLRTPCVFLVAMSACPHPCANAVSLSAGTPVLMASFREPVFWDAQYYVTTCYLLEEGRARGAGVGPWLSHAPG